MIFVDASPAANALADDFEEDYWVPFTHFHLGNRAFAGYETGVAHSGLRAFQVSIWGWAVRDFGTAYGYALYSTLGSPITELRVSLLYDSLMDTSTSPWDAFASGVSLDLLDPDFHRLGTYRYVTAYRPSANAGKCGPTLDDVVLDRDPVLHQWADVARSPASDFPAAPWSLARYVRVSVGFLCAAGLTGASYSLYFDDFVLGTGAGDSDGDGLGDLEEETRLYLVEISSGTLPGTVEPGTNLSAELADPTVSGPVQAAALSLDLGPGSPDDLVVTLESATPDLTTTYLLWDPGLHERRVATLLPLEGQAVRGEVRVSGRVAEEVPGTLARLYVDGVLCGAANRTPSGEFTLLWPSESWSEGTHELTIAVSGPDTGDGVATRSRPIHVVVDRSPPTVSWTSPRDGASVTGLIAIRAQLSDGAGLGEATLSVDGIPVEGQEGEAVLFAFDTLDLTNGPHRFEIRARDAAGNLGGTAVELNVDNQASSPPRPCLPACNVSEGTTLGDLPPSTFVPQVHENPLASGDRLRTTEALRLPWLARAEVTSDGTSLLLSLFSRPEDELPEGAVPVGLGPGELASPARWTVRVSHRGTTGAITVEDARLLVASRTSPSLADTDGDGLSDGDERSLGRTVPVIADMDDDGLPDGFEMAPREVAFNVDGVAFAKVLGLDPLNPDMDGDGLPDGRELFPPDGGNRSDPTNEDTDGDGLMDGVERGTYGSDPTRTDTDGDSLSDAYEVQPHPVTFWIDGMPQPRSVVTSPVSQDTDGDGLRDDVEWNGTELFGMRTDPSDADMDRDGLSDYEEVTGQNERPTNPWLADTDADGLLDSLDLVPLERWSLPWSIGYEPGLVRYTQRFKVLDVHGQYALIFKEENGACILKSNCTAQSTKSSSESEAAVLAEINRTFDAGGEHNLSVVRAMRVDTDQTGFAEFLRSPCGSTGEYVYRIAYVHHSHLYDIAFVNTAPYTIRDEEGSPFYHTVVDVPLAPSKAQNVILQFVLPADRDRTRLEGDSRTLPGFTFSLYRSRDFGSASSFYTGLAVASALDEHAYQAQLRIPREALGQANLSLGQHGSTATLVLTPAWFNSYGSNPKKLALNATSLNIGSFVVRRQESAEIIVARLDADAWGLEAALPPSLAQWASGPHTVGTLSLYVARKGDVLDAQVLRDSNAVAIVGSSEEEVLGLETNITWEPRGAWVVDARNDFGMTMGLMKIIRRGISITSALVAGILAPIVQTPTPAWETAAFERTTTSVVKLEILETSNPVYVIEEASSATVKVRFTVPETPNLALTATTVFRTQVDGDLVADINEAPTLASGRFVQVKAGMRGAAIGATLVIFGGQAVIAFREGDSIRGIVFSAAGTLSVIGVVKSDVELFRIVSTGQRFELSLRGRVGAVAAVAVGGILAVYDLVVGAQTNDAIAKLAHYEAAGATVSDTLIGAVPLYGPMVMIGWQIGLGLAIGFQRLTGLEPDILSARIAGSPGSALVFLFEYIEGVTIPSEIARAALDTLLGTLRATMQLNNSANPPSPTIILGP